MSIVQYVVYGSAGNLDDTVWKAIASALCSDGFQPTFTEDGVPKPLGSFTPRADARSVALTSGDADILLQFETRASNEALGLDRWPVALRPGLEQRSKSLFIQATGASDDLAFWNQFASRAAECLDGWIYSESSNALFDPYGNSPGTDSASDGDDEEVAIDWSSLPSPTAGPFTLVFRWDRWPSLYALDDLVGSIDDGLHRSASQRDGNKHPDTDRWTDVEYLGSCGELVVFQCGKPARTPAYVRVTFDVEPALIEPTIQTMRELVILAKRILPAIREQLRGFPIDVEA